MPIEPSQTEINAALHYEEGVLTWKSRDVPRVDTQFAGKVAGCERVDGYIGVAWKERRILAHRLIWIMHNGAIPDSLFVDHINRVRKDNRIENLRLCSVSENACNSKLRSDNTSKVKGINWDTQRNKWRARVAFKGKTFNAGFYNDLNDAADAIRIKREQIHKEFAAHHNALLEANQ